MLNATALETTQQLGTRFRAAAAGAEYKNMLHGLHLNNDDQSGKSSTAPTRTGDRANQSPIGSLPIQALVQRDHKSQHHLAYTNQQRQGSVDAL